jgi:hypothetical protein
MVQVCPRCQRANPPAAAFCWFDGNLLQHGAAPTIPTFPQEFVFPSGRRCRTFDELVQGCQFEWAAARGLLRSGALGQYLATIGRHDLAQAAEESQRLPDPDIALLRFIDQLPATPGQGPRLELSPRRLIIGPLRPGEQRQIALSLSNHGKGLLQGKVAISEGGGWLRSADGAAEVAVKTDKKQQVTLHIDGRGLTAAQAYSGKLTVVTNGGVAEVPVGLQVGAMPFPRAPFQGVSSPREMAEKFKASPKQAVPLLESGEVARWFRANGWGYPIAGTTARGVAAVQQFFEGMGLSKPPPLQLSHKDVQLVCEGPDTIESMVMLMTSAKKWVYAQADSDVPWLRVVSAVSGPQQAAIGFQVDPGSLAAGKIHTGTIQLTANAGQKLSVRVQVAVRRPEVSAAARWMRPILVGTLAALVLRLLLILPADVYARGIAGLPASEAAPIDVATWFMPPGGLFLRPFVLATWWIGALVGVILVVRASRQADRGGSEGGRRRRRQRSGMNDLFCGILAGAFAGLLASATMGSVLLLADAPALVALRGMVSARGPSPAPWHWIPLWCMMTTLLWAIWGAGLGALLGPLGRGGSQALTFLAAPVIGFFRLLHLNDAAAYFELSR